MRTIVLSLLVAVAIAANICAVYAAGGDDDKPTAADVEALVRQLGSPRFRDREDAQKKLEALGPAAVELLEPYRDDADAEVRTRVRVILKEHAWRRRGAVIYDLTRDSQAYKMGIKPGDVVLKLDEADIAKAADITTARDVKKATTLTILRNGKTYPAKFEAGKIGIWATDWDPTKGGDEQIEAFKCLKLSRFTEAQKMLELAVKKGLDDPLSLELAAAVADRNLDHDSAWAFYSRILSQDTAEERALTMTADMDSKHYQLPFSSCLADWVMREVDSSEYTPALAWYAENFSQYAGQNFDLANQLAAKPLPAEDPVRRNQLYRRMRIAFLDRRLDDVVRVYRDAATFDPALGAHFACRALIRLGRLDEAAELLDPLNRYTSSDQYEPQVIALGELMAAALAAGDGRLAARVYNSVLPTRNGYMFDGMFWTAPTNGLCMRPYAERMIARLNEYFAENPSCRWPAVHLLCLCAHVPNDVAVPVERVYEQARTVHAATAAQYYAVWLLRHGRYAEAEEFVSKEFGTGNSWLSRGPVDRAIAFQRDNADRLKTDWKELAGVTFVSDGPRGGTLAMKSTGEIYFLDKEGAIHLTTGVRPGALPDASHGDIIIAKATGYLYLHHSGIYLLDAENLRWLPTGLIPDRWGGVLFVYDHPSGPAFARYVMEKYGVAHAPQQTVRWAENLRNGWTVWNLWGDTCITINDQTGQILNISEEISARLGRAKPTRVFSGESNVKQCFILETEAGLWSLDEEGDLFRIQLPLKSNDVACRIIRWLRVPGKLYIGIAPQDGGQIIECDIESGQCKLTGGYNGLGPNDSRSWAGRTPNTNLGYDITHLELQRQLGAGAPTTAPADGE